MVALCLCVLKICNAANNWNKLGGLRKGTVIVGDGGIAEPELSRLRLKKCSL